MIKFNKIKIILFCSLLFSWNNAYSFRFEKQLFLTALVVSTIYTYKYFNISEKNIAKFMTVLGITLLSGYEDYKVEM